MDDHDYDDMLKKFWVASRDKEKDWDGITFWDLGLAEQAKVKEEMEYELRLEQSYNEKYDDYAYYCGR